MATILQNLSVYDEKNIPDGSNFQIGIVLSDWNAHITHELFRECHATLLKSGVAETNIKTVQVPGAFELPVAAKMLLGSEPFDAIICLGCVIKGETKHDEYINNAVAQGLTNLGIMTGKPVIFGLLTPDTEQQGLDRAGGIHGNKGVEAAVTALRMADLKHQLTKKKSSIGFSS